MNADLETRLRDGLAATPAPDGIDPSSVRGRSRFLRRRRAAAMTALAVLGLGAVTTATAALQRSHAPESVAVAPGSPTPTLSPSDRLTSREWMLHDVGSVGGDRAGTVVATAGARLGFAPTWHLHDGTNSCKGAATVTSDRMALRQGSLTCSLLGPSTDPVKRAAADGLAVLASTEGEASYRFDGDRLVVEQAGTRLTFSEGAAVPPSAASSTSPVPSSTSVTPATLDPGPASPGSRAQ